MKPTIRLAAMAVAATAIFALSSCGSQRAATATAQTAATEATQPVQMILDSDFGSSTDDLFALMMINHYIDDGLVDLKGIIVDREGEKNAGVVDIFNTYYGHPNIPIGLERNGVKNPRCFIPYNGICDLTDAAGKPLFERSVDTRTLPDGYKLYRKLLSEAADKSISIVAIGFATTLSQLMESGADEYSPLSGLDLLERKVKAVYIQSGRFEAGDSLCGYNMRAASRQSAIFYDKLPASVDLVMSPSNIGDAMDYAPKDVLTDLSTTDLNPIKSVYTYYTCDTGQRMWDTNCVVNAVLGDTEYYMSPRGWVTFVDKGQNSLMLFKEDPNGNARYQLPGDSYFAQTKLMDIRRHTRNHGHPAVFTIESPQPQLTKWDATTWVIPRAGQLIDKYLGSAGNKLDPNDVRAMLRPIGYINSNEADYKSAERILVDTLYTTMLKRTLERGNRTLVIVSGPPASGKSTAVKTLNLKSAGLVYDADLSEGARLNEAIARAKQMGMDDIALVMVRNDLLTCFKNAVNRGKTEWRFTPVDQMIAAFRNNQGNLNFVQNQYPDVEIIPVDCTGNQGIHVVDVADALKWNYEPTQEEIRSVLSYLLEAIEKGDLKGSEVIDASGDVLAIPNLEAPNRELARAIDAKVQLAKQQLR